jgi:hypothetical protein
MDIKGAKLILNSRNVYLQGNKSWKQRECENFFCEPCTALGVTFDSALNCGLPASSGFRSFTGRIKTSFTNAAHSALV